MQVAHLTPNVMSTLVSLIEHYKDRDIPASDFLDSRLSNFPDLEENELTCLIELFFSIHRYEQFLYKVVEYFYCLTKRSNHSDKLRLVAINYLILFELSRETFDKIKELLLDFGLKMAKQIMLFYNRMGIYNDILEAGCAYFGYEFVTDKMLNVFKTDKKILKDLLGDVKKLLEDNQSKNKIHPTVPLTPEQMKYVKKLPPPPCNTPEEIKVPISTLIPESTYKEPKVIEKIEIEKRKNKSLSIQLYNEAQNLAPNLQPQPHVHSCQTEVEVKPCMRRGIPDFSTPDVTVKPNAAMLLREAARIIKEEEKEIKRIEALEAGGANYTKYESLVKEIKDEEEKLHLQEIERKHLKGLLTREEAIIAKHRLENENKLKRNQFEKEKEKLVNYIKEMKENEYEKIKNTINKVQMIQKNIEVKKENLQKQKNKTAQEVSEVSKKLLEEAIKKRKEEMNARIAIIEEIKALSNLRDLRTTEFDPSETMNLGLMCEMSLAELQERLLILRIDFKEDLEKRRNKIKQKRFKQQKFLTDTKEFLDLHRAYRKQIVDEEKEKEKEKNIPVNEEIIQLRLKLEEARERKKRYKINKTDL